jgi:hypothetical protein
MSLNFRDSLQITAGFRFSCKKFQNWFQFPYLQKKNQAVPDPHLCTRKIKPIPDLMVIAGIFVCYSCLEAIGG